MQNKCHFRNPYDSEEIWNMQYSGNSLKIWKKKRSIFIDLIIIPGIIIIKRLETTFNGKPFRIYNQRKPQQRQVDKIINKVKECEEWYNTSAQEVDMRYRNQMEDIRGSIKESNKIRILMYLYHEYCKEFSWPWQYYMDVIEQILEESPVFKKQKVDYSDWPPEIRKMKEDVAILKEKYKDVFEEFKDTVVEYNSHKWAGFVQL